MESRIPTCSHIPISWLQRKLPVSTYDCFTCRSLKIRKPLTKYERQVHDRLVNILTFSKIEEWLLSSGASEDLVDQILKLNAEFLGFAPFENQCIVCPSLTVVVELEHIEDINSQPILSSMPQEEFEEDHGASGKESDAESEAESKAETGGNDSHSFSDHEDYIYPTTEDYSMKCHTPYFSFPENEKRFKFASKTRNQRSKRKGGLLVKAYQPPKYISIKVVDYELITGEPYGEIPGLLREHTRMRVDDSFFKDHKDWIDEIDKMEHDNTRYRLIDDVLFSYTRV